MQVNKSAVFSFVVDDFPSPFQGHVSRSDQTLIKLSGRTLLWLSRRVVRNVYIVFFQFFSVEKRCVFMHIQRIKGQRTKEKRENQSAHNKLVCSKRETLRRMYTYKLKVRTSRRISDTIEVKINR
jgi:hypothetical protein